MGMISDKKDKKDKNESEELVAFRKQWLAELRQRRAGSIDTSSTADPSQPTSSSVVPPNEAPTESDYEKDTKLLR